MRILIAAVGRLRPGAIRDLFDIYEKRLPWPTTVREFEAAKGRNPNERIRREGGALLKAVPAGAVLVALDEGGRCLGSRAFAGRIGAWRDSGRADIAFVLGGADGLDKDVTAGADLVLAFGSMTWPHLLARAMLMEQLYRASSILSGHPYHRA